MAGPRRVAMLLATGCFALCACAETVTTDTTDPLRAPVEPSTTTSSADVADPPPGFEWTTVELEFGVSDITDWGTGMVGLAVQDYEAPSSLIEQGDTGCVGFQAGRTGEVVWSADGVEWKSLDAQPSWYTGTLSPEAWGWIVRSGQVPSVAQPGWLATHGDHLLAMWFDVLTETEADVVVDLYEPADAAWRRLGSLDSVGPNRFAVAAADGPGGAIIVAAGGDSDPTVWTVSSTGLVEFADPFGEPTAGFDEGWAADGYAVELAATSDGFLAQLEGASGGPLMAFSVDGSSWTRVAHPGAGPVGLAASGATVLGTNGDGMWVSTDNGESWDTVRFEGLTGSIDLTGSASGFAAWMFEEGWTSPTVWRSRDGVTWAPVLELSQDYGWINGVAFSNDVMVVSVDASPGGWVCPEIMGHEYEIHLGTTTGVPPE